MAKNERFDDTITIRIKGRSTNRFVPNMLEKFLVDYVAMINAMYQQSDATIEVVQDLPKKKSFFSRGN